MRLLDEICTAERTTADPSTQIAAKKAAIFVQDDSLLF
jgi:hypothetical protein